MSSLQDLGFFVHNNPEETPKGVTPFCVELQDREKACSTPHMRNFFELLHEGKIVNEKPLNLKKTTSSVLSVLLLIYEPITQELADIKPEIYKSLPQILIF